VRDGDVVGGAALRGGHERLAKQRPHVQGGIRVQAPVAACGRRQRGGRGLGKPGASWGAAPSQCTAAKYPRQRHGSKRPGTPPLRAFAPPSSP
jgi:hypothetical protein